MSFRAQTIKYLSRVHQLCCVTYVKTRSLSNPRLQPTNSVGYTMTPCSLSNPRLQPANSVRYKPTADSSPATSLRNKSNASLCSTNSVRCKVTPDFRLLTVYIVK
jgi:hypothetical protein